MRTTSIFIGAWKHDTICFRKCGPFHGYGNGGNTSHAGTLQGKITSQVVLFCLDRARRSLFKMRCDVLHERSIAPCATTTVHMQGSAKK